MAIGWNKFHHPKPPVDIELLIWDVGIWATLTILNLIWNLSPYIACSNDYYFMGNSTALIQ